MSGRNRRVLVTGSRNWVDVFAVWNALDEQLELARRDGATLTVVHGSCPTGADAIADRWATRRRYEGFPVAAEPHPADWRLYGRSAGVIRNQEMAELGAVVCLAFPLGESRGTRHCMKAASGERIPVVIHRSIGGESVG